jgi:predicted unusual protein kinase regulating ubiquinone biosynthesis (AarF/ABC1/UbiB family)
MSAPTPQNGLTPTFVQTTLAYSPERVEQVFRLRQLLGSPQAGAFVSRFWVITQFFATYMARTWWDNQLWTMVGQQDLDVAQSLRRKQTARWLTRALLQLGPTFIKVGQQISSRVDLIRKEMVDELGTLQDQVPPFAWSDALAILETELGGMTSDHYEWLDPNHLAAASLGQVHRARLKTTQEEVIVKIQRPNLVGIFELDLAIMRKLARYGEKWLPLGKGRDWVGIVDEFGKTLFNELDYIQEGRNADTFRQQFAQSPLKAKVHFPRIHWPLTARRVITMEYAPGIKINDVMALNRAHHNLPDLSHTVIKVFFEQILVHGFYHADPHPGNLAVRDDGVIIVYDFGMVGVIPDKSRKLVVDTFLNIVGKRPDALLGNLIDLDMIAPNADIEVMRELVIWLLDSYYDVPHDQLNFEQLTDDLAEVMYEHPFNLPANITFMIRALVTLEGIATTLHPQIKLINSAIEYAQDFMGKTLDLPYLLTKTKEFLGLPIDGHAVKATGRVRLHNDEWTAIGRYIKTGFVLLGLGQGVLVLLVLVNTAMAVWPHIGAGWVLGTTGVLVSVWVLALSALVKLPSRKKAVLFKASALKKPDQAI